MIPKTLIKKCMLIKLVLTDVDGVLTDGGRFYSSTGEMLKRFHTRDGMGVNLLLRNGIKTGIVTKEKSLIVKKWATEMNVSKIYGGAIHKETTLPKICRDFSLKPSEIAYIGDDVNDLDLMGLVGLSAAPNDAVDQIKKIANYVCKNKSGDGSFREFADVILHIQFPNKAKWY